MKLNKNTFLLYAVTDRNANTRPLHIQVEEALKGGVTILQLREKNLPEDEFLASAMEIKEICHKYGVPFIINDNVAVARKCGADGVHLGQDDMSLTQARSILGDDKIIGASAHNLEEAIAAQKAGADYLGCGAVFGTSTKADVSALSIDALKSIAAGVDIPVVAIGGVGEDNISILKGSEIAGVAVCAAIFASEDIAGAAKRLRSIAEEI